MNQTNCAEIRRVYDTEPLRSKFSNTSLILAIPFTRKKIVKTQEEDSVCTHCNGIRRVM